MQDELLEQLTRGVMLEDGTAKFDTIERIGNTDSHDWFRVVVKEGRNREVRRLWESQGCQVSRLKRTRYGSVLLPRELLRGQSTELPKTQVEALRTQLKLEKDMPLALTLQPVIGQRRSAKATLHVNRNDNNKHAYHNNHSTADESRELRRFDTLRDDRGRGQGKHHFKDRLTVSGEAAAKQAHKPFKQYKPKNDRSLSEGSPATFQSWYVPEGVSTGPRNHRNAGAGNGAHPNKKSPNPNTRNTQGQQTRKSPYKYTNNAPNFPSDHATPTFNPYGNPGQKTGAGQPNNSGGKYNRNRGPRYP